MIATDIVHLLENAGVLQHLLTLNRLRLKTQPIPLLGDVFQSLKENSTQSASIKVQVNIHVAALIPSTNIRLKWTVLNQQRT